MEILNLNTFWGNWFLLLLFLFSGTLILISPSSFLSKCKRNCHLASTQVSPELPLSCCADCAQDQRAQLPCLLEPCRVAAIPSIISLISSPQFPLFYWSWHGDLVGGNGDDFSMWEVLTGRSFLAPSFCPVMFVIHVLSLLSFQLFYKVIGIILGHLRTH